MKLVNLDFLGLKTPIEKLTVFQKTNIIVVASLVMLTALIFAAFIGTIIGSILKILFYKIGASL
jgi:hypothetical protein